MLINDPFQKALLGVAFFMMCFKELVQAFGFCGSCFLVCCAGFLTVDLESDTVTDLFSFEFLSCFCSILSPYSTQLLFYLSSFFSTVFLLLPLFFFILFIKFGIQSSSFFKPFFVSMVLQFFILFKIVQLPLIIF